MSDQKNSKDLNLQNLTLNDEIDENGCRVNESQQMPSRLEEIILDSNIELNGLGKTKKTNVQNDTKVPSVKPIQPKLSPNIILINPSTQLNANGQYILWDQTSGTFIKFQNNTATQIPPNLINSTNIQNINVTSPQNNNTQIDAKIKTISNSLKSALQQQQQQQQQQENLSYSVQSPQTQINYSMPVSPSQIAPQSVSQMTQLGALVNSSSDALYASTQPSPSSFINSTPSTPGLHTNNFLDLNDDFSEIMIPDLIPNPLNHQQFDMFNQSNLDSLEQTINTCNTNADEREICSAEIALLPSLANIVRLKKDRGETFIHQLAQSRQILHTVSKPALRRLYQRDDILNPSLKLTSHIFMQYIIDRAIRDQELNNQPTLLYDIINIKNEFNETPLILAIQKDRDEFVRLLIENGAHPNILTMPDMHTALHKACINGACNSFTILLQIYLKDEYKSTINQLDKDGNTALMLAIKYHSKSLTINTRSIKINNLSIIKQLLETNLADKKILNFENNTCVHLLCENGDCSIEDKLRILKMLRTDLRQLIEVKNIFGKSAWDSWNGMRLIEQPEVLLKKAEEIEIPV